jgi:Leucine-rich repeat (LRR) protein
MAGEFDVLQDELLSLLLRKSRWAAVSPQQNMNLELVCRKFRHLRRRCGWVRVWINTKAVRQDLLIKYLKTISGSPLEMLAISDASRHTRIKPVLGLLSPLHMLTFLDLGRVRIGEEGAMVLAPVLGKLTRLTSLDLRNNYDKDVGAAALAPELGKLTSLTSLNLKDNSLYEVGAAALAQELGKLTGLTSLLLGGNDFEDAGAVALAPVLGKLALLNTLDLGGAIFEENGMMALRLELGNLAGLTHLVLATMPSGAMLGLGKFTGLTVLDFTQTYWDKALDAATFNRELGKLTGLTSLELENCEMGEDCGAALVPVLGKLTGLTYLGLY